MIHGPESIDGPKQVCTDDGKIKLRRSRDVFALMVDADVNIVLADTTLSGKSFQCKHRVGRYYTLW